MQPDDRRTLTLRLGALQYLLATAFAALAVSFWMFQVAHHERFREMAENNHMRRLPLPAPRGVLVDRNGKVLVQNQDVMNIVLVREQTKDIESTLRTLAAGDRGRLCPAERNRRPSPQGSELPPDHPDRKREPAAGGRRCGAIAGDAGHRVPADARA